MKYYKKDHTIFDIEEVSDPIQWDKTIYKIKNLTTGQTAIRESIDDFICCDTPEDRMIIEVSDLEDKISKLSIFLDTEKFNSLPAEHQSLLIKQNTVMKSYRDILRRRLELM